MTRVPSYRCKKSNGRKYACVSLPDGTGGRRDVLLGKYGSEESKAEYDRVISEWTARRSLNRPEPTPDITVNELMAAYWEHAQRYYRDRDGNPTGELNGIRLALRPLKELYGHTPAAQFGPLALQAIREKLIRQPITTRIKVIDTATGKASWQDKVLRIGLARGPINQRIGVIRRMFRWAASQQLGVTGSMLKELESVIDLREGRSEARETEPVRPVSVALVEETLPHLSPTVADIIRLLLLTGARSGEICIMRAIDIETSGLTWIYSPRKHKTQHRGFGREIVLGPKAQKIVKRYLKGDPEAFLFSPRESVDVFRRMQRLRRKSKVQPSQICRKKKNPSRVPRERYDPRAIAHAVYAACRKHGLEHWHPHQLRHTKATEIRRSFDPDTARAVLGQKSIKVTEHYAQLDLSKAVEVARKLG
jgi:integrase